MLDSRGEELAVGSYVAVINTAITCPRLKPGQRAVAKRGYVDSIDEAAGTCVVRKKSGLRKLWTCQSADVVKIR